ncbi:hypothetical protein RN22_07525 [Grimontia sp. AD028]|uniref:DUF3261 domain-containing protein n=1 Tax=Grimontia sp. AD028 TaxID=1581149 RepID=UPI00061A9C30|nr:DUF3261 domain-containing protein [Grimontia sp. AD028]KKD61138.1 hypothetical protein RN22_07525 [Grimontia sp. AD028]
MIRVVLCLAFSLLLSACAAAPDSNHVEIAPDKFVTLPAPSEFESTVSVNQLITAKWSDSTQVLPVHLEITESDVVLVGFSSWGTRLLTLNYDGQALETDNLTGLGAVLPDGKQVLMNLMLTLWPATSWQPHLSPIGWQLVDDATSRTLLDENGETVAKIQYDGPKVAGGVPADIQFEQVRQHYQIQIQTLE